MTTQERDRAVYEYLRQRLEEGCAPTVREICRALGIKSTSTAHASLNRLVRDGLIEKRGDNLNRAISLAGTRRNELVPVVGTVAAGQPITAIEYIEGYVNFNPERRYRGQLFALKVRGDSMINAAILDGDTVIAEQCRTAKNGEIIVALVDGSDATVKRFYREKGYVRLQPENDAVEPIISKNVSVLGRVVAVIRYL